MLNAAPQNDKSKEIMDILISIKHEAEKCEALKQIFLISPYTLNTTYSNGRNLLHVASKLGLAEVSRLLLNLNFPLNQADQLGNTPLHYLAMNGSDAYDLLTLFTTQPSINLNLGNAKGNTPLHEAILNKSPKYVELLCAHPSCDLTLTNGMHQTPQEMVEEMQASLAKDHLMLALSANLFKDMPVLTYDDIFSSHEKMHDNSKNSQFSELASRFEELKLTQHETKLAKPSRGKQNPYALPLPYDAEKPTYIPPIILSEIDFIDGKVFKIESYLKNKGDPNAILQSITRIPSIRMPLIFYAFFHKQKEIMLLLIEHHAQFTAESITKLQEIFRTAENDTLAHFTQEMLFTLLPRHEYKTSVLSKLIEESEYIFQESLVTHRLPTKFVHYNTLDKKTMKLLFPDKKKRSAATFIYEVCSGAHSSNIRQFDFKHVNQCTLGLLDQLSPNEFLEMLSILTPKFNPIQRLIALYVLKQVFIFNIELNYNFSRSFEKRLKSHLNKFYHSDLNVGLLNLFNHIQNLRNNTVISNFHLLNYFLMLHPSQHKPSIYEYIDKILDDNPSDISPIAKLLANEFRIPVMQILRNVNLKELRGDVWGINKAERNIDSPHFIIFEKRWDAISALVKNCITKQPNPKRKANAFRLFTFVATACLNHSVKFDADCNTACAIYVGLETLENNITIQFDELLDSKTNDTFSKLKVFFSPTANFKPQREFLKLAPSAIPRIAIYCRDKLPLVENDEAMDFELLSKLFSPILQSKTKYKTCYMESSYNLEFELYKLNPPFELLPKSQQPPLEQEEQKPMSLDTTSKEVSSKSITRTKSVGQCARSRGPSRESSPRTQNSIEKTVSIDNVSIDLSQSPPKRSNIKRSLTDNCSREVISSESKMSIDTLSSVELPKIPDIPNEKRKDKRLERSRLNGSSLENRPKEQGGNNEQPNRTLTPHFTHDQRTSKNHRLEVHEIREQNRNRKTNDHP